ncbi:hypothetical protein HDU83_003977 [Entophlyctis luteolus]|nr:hypothetical protein HDU82_004268 [Entophlyctis luteolus]KAJ3355080.1 hypothetical protein HDU83_003977 [Entophlyctis luteolus]
MTDRSSSDCVIPAGGRYIVPTDISIAVPSGTYGRVAPRSGLAVKHFLDVGAGVIDADYRGPVGVVMFNFGTTAFAVKEGDRIAQLILEKIEMAQVEQVAELQSTRLDFVTRDVTSPTNRPSDPPLSALGFAQADACTGAPITGVSRIYSSPFSRCIQTALPVSRAMGIPIRVEPGVGEWFSAHKHVHAAGNEGIPHAQPAPVPEILTALNLPAGRAGGCIDTDYVPVCTDIKTETIDQVHARLKSVLDAILATVPAGDAGDAQPHAILIVTHAASLIAAARALVGDPRLDVVAGVCSLTKLVEVTTASGGSRWEVEANGDARHLDACGGLLHVWRFPTVAKF